MIRFLLFFPFVMYCLSSCSNDQKIDLSGKMVLDNKGSYEPVSLTSVKIFEKERLETIKTEVNLALKNLLKGMKEVQTWRDFQNQYMTVITDYFVELNSDMETISNLDGNFSFNDVPKQSLLFANVKKNEKITGHDHPVGWLFFIEESFVILDESNTFQNLIPLEFQIHRKDFQQRIDEVLSEKEALKEKMLASIKADEAFLKKSPLVNHLLKLLKDRYPKPSNQSLIDYLKSFESVNLYRLGIRDLSSLVFLSNLTNLEIYRNDIDNLEPLSRLTNLKKLDLTKNKIFDISPLENLENLTSLSLSRNNITSLTSLSKLTDLKELYLSKNQISDLEPLKDLKSLEILALDRNIVTDISPLLGLENLQLLEIYGNEIPSVQIIQLKKNLPKCEVFSN
jgi:hypothetical protein